MNESLTQSVLSNPLSALLSAALSFAIYVILVLAPVCAVLYLVYFLLTLPLRRNERARLFVDLLELGLRQGRSPEAAILAAASSRDPALGARFRLLKSYLEKGLRLSAALERVPRLLPPQLCAMLQTAERTGDLTKVLPACRRLLQDGVSRVRGGLNYVLVIGLAITPCLVLLPLLFRAVILPKFAEVFAGMTAEAPLPAFTRLVFGTSAWTTALQAGLVCLLWLAVLVYVAGPRASEWVGRLAPGLPDWVVSLLPWRRKRLQRDFSAILAVLLDSEVPEPEAVALAADATANGVMKRRAAKVCQLLKEGARLPEALRAMDDTGELHWRLSNALQHRGGFVRALAGWHDALEAKAFQLEQSAAQIATTLLVLLNGAIVASIVVAVFLVIIRLIQAANRL
jgi:type II secretory pathway component PulF